MGVERDLEQALDVCVLTKRVAQIFFYTSMLNKVQQLPPEAVEAETAIFRMRKEGDDHKINSRLVQYRPLYCTGGEDAHNPGDRA